MEKVRGYLLHCQTCHRWVAIKEGQQSVICRFCNHVTRIKSGMLITLSGTYHEAYQRALALNRENDPVIDPQDQLIPFTKRGR
jgi:hypothetical protein